jgi:hypothetical protein
VGILHGLDCVFGSKSTHYESQLAVSGGLDGKAINAQDILRSMGSATVYFHNKLNIFHGPFPFLPIRFPLAMQALANHLASTGIGYGRSVCHIHIEPLIGCVMMREGIPGQIHSVVTQSSPEQSNKEKVF